MIPESSTPLSPGEQPIRPEPLAPEPQEPSFPHPEEPTVPLDGGAFE